jgi:hypothetical protein
MIVLLTQLLKRRPGVLPVPDEGRRSVGAPSRVPGRRGGRVHVPRFRRQAGQHGCDSAVRRPEGHGLANAGTEPSCAFAARSRTAEPRNVASAMFPCQHRSIGESWRRGCRAKETSVFHVKLGLFICERFHGDRMRRLSIALFLLALIAGCSRNNDSAYPAKAPPRSTLTDGASRYLAYQHSIQIDTEEGKVAAIFEAGQAACREAAIDSCTVLESRISTGRAASATLKFRSKPSGIRKLIAALGKQGEITDQSTSAEDLAGPIEDAAKKLEMLNDFRTKLEALRGGASSNVDALIKVNRELAQVQSELEAMAGKHAHLVQRVETEILNIAIRSDHNQSFGRPIALSMSDFGANLSQGVSIAITGIAYLIPWGFILFLAAWVGRKLWRRRKRVMGNANG